MKRSKVLLTLLCAVALVATSVFGTLAYLTDKESVTNTFTVGQVGIKLDEAKVDVNGKPDGTNRWQPTTEDPAQEYHLLPGHTYTKDPTVTVDAGSERAYVRMLATITYKAEADAVFAKYQTDALFAPWLDINSNWIVNGAPVTEEDVVAGTISRTYEFRYKSDVAKSATATKLPALFTTLTVPGAVTNEEIAHLQDMVISVEAHAIQADGFTNAADAWDHFTA